MDTFKFPIVAQTVFKRSWRDGIQENYCLFSESYAICLRKKTFHKCKNVHLNNDTCKSKMKKANRNPTGVSATSPHITQKCETHFWANVVLLGPVCLFWHKIDWLLRLDVPPVATRHAWLLIKNISPSSWLHPWLHISRTKICSHAVQDLWHGPYIRLSGNECSVNTIAPLSSGWLPLCSYRLSAWWLRDI